MRLVLIISFAVIIGAAGVAATLGYSARQPQLDSLQDEVADLSGRLGAYHEIAAYQEEMAYSLRDELDDSLGDRLVVTEAIYQELPMTIAAALDQGYSLLDTVNNDGVMIEAACFAHEGVRHYGKVVSRTTDGVKWHGAPLLLMYNINGNKLAGMVLESTTSQVAPPWEYHTNGHPGMDFPHWSLHFWFTNPPKNLSLEHKH